MINGWVGVFIPLLYSDEDLEEPFSDSDDESPRHREPQKMQLPIPRGRIRTLSGTVPVVSGGRDEDG